ncbi:MAG: shikimate kinase [Bacteroidales bacterium]
MRRFFLVGYMGAGKTTLGKIVAQEMNLSFVDLDTYIENRHHKSVSDIFKEKGEAGFRIIEREALQEVSEFVDVLIATGGGVPCFFDNAEWMDQHGLTIYLKTDTDVLFNRLKIARSARPILKDKSDHELRSFIVENLKKREPFYLKSRLIFDANNLDSRSQLLEASEKLISLIRDHTV